MKLILSSSGMAARGFSSLGDKLLLKSAQKRGLEIRIVDPIKISYEFNDKVKAYDGSHDIYGYDILLVRRTRDAELESYQLAKVMEENNAVVVDPAESLIYPTSKLVPQIERFSKGHFPKSVYVQKFSRQMLEDVILKTLDFPMIIKPQNGTGKKGFSVINNAQEVDDYFRRQDCAAIFQEYIDIRTSYRVMTIGRKTAGCHYMKSTQEYVGEGDAVKIAEEIASVSSALILGVDIVRDKRWKYYVLEANRNPNFTEINGDFGKRYDEMIIDYCIESRKKQLE